MARGSLRCFISALARLRWGEKIRKDVFERGGMVQIHNIAGQSEDESVEDKLKRFNYYGSAPECIVAVQWCPSFPVHRRRKEPYPSKFGIHFTAPVYPNVGSQILEVSEVAVNRELRKKENDTLRELLQEYWPDLKTYTWSGGVFLWTREYNIKGRYMGLSFMQYTSYSMDICGIRLRAGMASSLLVQTPCFYLGVNRSRLSNPNTKRDQISRGSGRQSEIWKSYLWRRFDTSRIRTDYTSKQITYIVFVI